LWTVSAENYNYPKIGSDVQWQLNNIKRRLEAGEGEKMQAIFPEGWFFSYILYGYSWVNVALTSPSESLRQQAIREIKWVLQQIDTPKGKAPFSFNTQVTNGVFYLGWSNRLLGGLLKIQKSSERAQADLEKFHGQSQELAKAFLLSPNLHLEAYPGMTWPCDQTVALASLVLHDSLFNTNYRSISQKWIEHTKLHLDPQTGLIPHKIDSVTGAIEIAARGSSQVYMLSFLSELDEVFAKQQYDLFYKHFVMSSGSFYPVREYPSNVSGVGDIDSGPVILGIGPTSTIVSLVAAKANQDLELFESSLLLIEIFGFPWTWNEEKSYAMGSFLVIDDFVLWGKTLVPWTKINLSHSEGEMSSLRRRWLWLSGSGIFLLIIMWQFSKYHKYYFNNKEIGQNQKIQDRSPKHE
jgi:hypothetical protein